MCATVEHGGQADVAADEERADALGGVDLVAGEGEEVNVFEWAFGAEIERELAGGLDGVGVEESAGGVGDGGEFGDGLGDAGLVVREHDADEPGVGADGCLQGGGLDDALWRALEEGDIYFVLCEGLGGVEDGVVLDGGGDEVGGSEFRWRGRRRGRGCRSRCRRR